MTDDTKVQISIEPTPNPNAARYVVNRALVREGALDCPDRESAASSPLAVRLFELTWVTGVLIGTNFITVSKSEKVQWNAVAPEAVQVIQTFLESGSEVVTDKPGASQKHADPVSQKICKILDEEIRPAVAMDGGDITFVEYKDGVVQLNLRGACSSCPSSIMTLKMGVEQRLKQSIPEIKEVMHV